MVTVAHSVKARKPEDAPSLVKVIVVRKFPMDVPHVSFVHFLIFSFQSYPMS